MPLELPLSAPLELPLSDPLDVPLSRPPEPLPELLGALPPLALLEQAGKTTATHARQTRASPPPP
jgi:hypothetical protein